VVEGPVILEEIFTESEDVIVEAKVDVGLEADEAMLA
jgi:hypothetical protein